MRALLQQALDALVDGSEIARNCAIKDIRTELAKQVQEPKRVCNPIDCMYIDGLGSNDCDWCRQQPTAESVYEAIKHGDDQHRTWLRDALTAIWAGRPVPELQPSAQPVQKPLNEEAVYETIINWDERGGKRSRRELARRIVAIYTAPPVSKEVWRMATRTPEGGVRYINLVEVQPAPKPHHDDIAVDRFADAMKAKMAKQRAKGYGGWDNKYDCSATYLQGMLVDHIAKGDPVDVGNFAMMLFNRGERTAQPAQEPIDEQTVFEAWIKSSRGSPWPIALNKADAGNYLYLPAIEAWEVWKARSKLTAAPPQPPQPPREQKLIQAMDAARIAWGRA